MNSGLYAKESNKFMIQGKVTQYSYKHYTIRENAPNIV